MKTLQSNTLSTGLAMFSMFFGAGNVIFPLAIGQYAQDHNFYAILGLLITAVGVPFIGLLAMTLFDGDYKAFFGRIGKWPGFLVSLFIMGLIGPFGATPRVITVSYSTLQMFFPGLSLLGFSAISCLIIFLMTFKRSKILDILGYFLTPILLVSLAIIIIKGAFFSDPTTASEDHGMSIFFTALLEGYKTMDLLATFFFSSVVILCLRQELHPEDQNDFRRIVSMTLQASCIGAGLLAITYVGISYAGAHNSAILKTVAPDQMMGALAIHMMGFHWGIVAVIAVAMACLTTAIALAAAFAEFVHEDLTMKKVSYQMALLFCIVVTFFMSTLNFNGIMEFLAPILFMCYPALIVLSVVNILHKVYGFEMVKTPVFLTLAGTIAVYYL